MLMISEHFREELARIHNNALREHVRECLDAHHYQLIDLPASRNNHHPPDERGKLGWVIHAKRVSWFCKCIGEELLLGQDDMDALHAAALLHDISRYRTSGSGHEYDSAIIVDKFLRRDVDAAMRVRVMKLIMRHMAHWYGEEVPVDELERLFCLADYVVSREEVLIGVLK